jgi:hypothetical protein
MLDFHKNELMERWAESWGVRLLPWRRLRPGESYCGLVRIIASGQRLSEGALEELRGLVPALMVSEVGERPADPGPGTGASAGSSEAEPPIDNMGGKLTEAFPGVELDCGLSVGVDWFNGVGKGESARELLKAELVRWFGPGQSGLGGLHSYSCTWSWECGAVLAWSPGRSDWLISVNARSFQVVGQDRHFEFLLSLHSLVDHVTRLDVRLDDYTRQIIDLGKVESARLAGNFAGFRVCGRFGDSKLQGGRLLSLGETITFGKRGRDGSGRYIRFYDKSLESKGRICSNRMEVEYSKKHADAAFRVLVSVLCADHSGPGVLDVQAAAVALGKLVVGAIEFVDRSSSSPHLGRLPVLDWWSSIVSQVGAVRVQVQRAVSTLAQKTVAHARQWKNVLGRAFAVAEGMGHDLGPFLLKLIQDARVGRELADVPLSPLEEGFDPVRAFALC